MKTKFLKCLGFASVIFASMDSRADSLVVMLDISSSTPIVDQNFMRSNLPIISTQISKLPLGSTIKVFSVGDDNALPISIDKRVERRETGTGDKASELASIIPNMIIAYLNRLRSKPTLMQNESSLSPAFLDASKYCQAGAHCQITYLTDGMEYQPGILDWPREYKKPLPKITGLNLNGANVLMLGVGMKVTSQARISIEQHWIDFLKKSGAGTVELKRI